MHLSVRKIMRLKGVIVKEIRKDREGVLKRELTMVAVVMISFVNGEKSR